jgi:hypothetical protein
VFFAAGVPQPGQEGILRVESPDKLDPSCPVSPVIQDQEPPAPIVPAYPGTGEVDGAECLLASRFVPEKRAGVGEDFKDAFVFEELDLVRVDGYRGLLAGILVVHNKPVIPELHFYGVNVPEMAAAIAALETFEGQDSASVTGCSARWQG